MTQQTVIEMGSAGAAASLAVLITNPLDVAKTRLQMRNELMRKPQGTEGHGYMKNYRGIVHCITETYKSEGVLGIQRGLNVAIVREFGKCCVRIGMYDPLVRYLNTTLAKHLGDEKKGSFVINLTAASICGVAAAVLFNPLDMAKTRTQASLSTFSTSHYDIPKNTSVPSILRAICKPYEHATFKITNLWYGTTTNVIRSISFTAVMLPTNSSVKQSLQAFEHSFATASKQVGIGEPSSGAIFANIVRLVGPFLGSLLGVAVMNPIDVIRTRLYNQPRNLPRTAQQLTSPAMRKQPQQLYRSFFDCGIKIITAEGLPALWKGAGSHFLRVGPHTVLTFLFMEQIRTVFI